MTDAAALYRQELIEAGLLIPTGVDGLYGRSAVFESVVEGLERSISRMAAPDGAELMRFPPMMSRKDFLASGYLKGFPHLFGSVHCFCGNEADHRQLLEYAGEGKDFSDLLEPSGVVLTPAACYPVYPVVSRRGTLPPGGRLIDVSAYCFRHEPSLDPCRMQLFRMRENIRVGSADEVLDFREKWLQRGLKWVERLALPAVSDLANDPFFGRGGKLMAAGQRDQQLKFELLVPVTSTEKPTACLSFNYHMTHFAEIWPIHQADGELAHTGCVGFGLERLTLALLRHHGLDPTTWPQTVRGELWPDK
ncbi:MAG TPA: amino acid--[acyl-carrier-protein] ligase [Stellaceae bacterium]|nr:amino acid--[acyl-carrier-protein] ligase [Stellaceae bacterium]